jgi:hypothetical protein
MAEAVASGKKLVENRSWGRNVRGTIAIHRGGKGGAIIALVDVVDVVEPVEALKKYPRQKQWICGPWCWILKNVRRIPPVPCKGRLSLWEVNDNLVTN